MAAASLAPLLPKLDAILVLDGDGNRLAGKYYGDFLKKVGEGGKSPEEQRTLFEKQMHAKIAGIAARPDAAEVVQCQGRTAVFCGGTVGGGGGAGGAGTTGDVRVVHVGPPNESELVLAHCCEGMYDALSQLMGGSTDRAMVLDNLELVFLLIDEHCDGGIILEVDGSKLAAAVLLRDEDHAGDDGHGHAAASSGGRLPGMPQGVSTDMTLGQAFRQIGGQLMAAAANRDGM